ncbi:MAG: hypothetical protein J6M43_07965 [Neisseriaceae bacterium]|nr:hypothetical protein [Neisseriaceae bacterium]
MKDLTYDEAIEQVMLNNGKFASLKQIYNEIWHYKDKSKITGKTPNNTIQERVQRSNKFFRIGLGIYGLTEFKNEIFITQNQPKTEQEKTERKHSQIQGMLIEIGNLRGFDTYTNDKSWIFDGKQLGNLISLKSVPLFTYEKIIAKSVSFCDVIWFGGNEFLYPTRICEVEHSTDFRDALIKFKELEFFNTQFYCISDENRRNKFELEINKKAFESIRNRVQFQTYKEIEETYHFEMKRIRF